MIEDESKFKLKKNVSAVIQELRNYSGKIGEWREMTDTYFKLYDFAKKASLRIRDTGYNRVPTLKIPITKVKRGNLKRTELEDLVSIEKELGVRLNTVDDLRKYFEQDLVVKQKRFVVEYNGVEFTVDDVKYENNSGKEIHCMQVMEMELKDSNSEITRREVIKKLKGLKIIGKPLKLNKYEIGIKKI